MANRTVWPLQNNQMALSGMLVWVIDNPTATDYDMIEQTSFNFYVTKVKAVVVTGTSTPNFDYTLKRIRNGVAANIGSTVTNVDTALDSATITDDNGAIYNEDLNGAANGLGDSLRVTLANIGGTVTQIKFEIDFIYGVKEVA